MLLGSSMDDVGECKVVPTPLLIILSLASGAQGKTWMCVVVMCLLAPCLG